MEAMERDDSVGPPGLPNAPPTAGSRGADGASGGSARRATWLPPWYLVPLLWGAGIGLTELAYGPLEQNRPMVQGADGLYHGGEVFYPHHALFVLTSIGSRLLVAVALTLALAHMVRWLLVRKPWEAVSWNHLRVPLVLYGVCLLLVVIAVVVLNVPDTECGEPAPPGEGRFYLTVLAAAATAAIGTVWALTATLLRARDRATVIASVLTVLGGAAMAFLFFVAVVGAAMSCMN